jgi:putative ABC transport system substrate-binding protein
LGGAVALLAAPLAAEAQQPGKVVRVGLLALGSLPAGSDVGEQAIVQGLKEHGYIEGQNLILERRFVEGEASRLPQLAAELVQIPVDVILVAGPGPIQAAKRATTTIPIVMAAGSVDPVAEGLVASLARPGGNITGLTYAASTERFGKQLELLKMAATRASRIAVLWDLPLDMFRRTWADPMHGAAQLLGLEVQEPVLVNAPQSLQRAFDMMHKQKVHAVLVATGGIIFGIRREVGKLAVQYGLPTMAAFKEFPQAGGLMSYGPDLPDIYRKAGGYVGRILRGARPADLPVEQPTKFELVINLKTAKALGLTIPPSLLARADQVIE